MDSETMRQLQASPAFAHLNLGELLKTDPNEPPLEVGRQLAPAERERLGRYLNRDSQLSSYLNHCLPSKTVQEEEVRVLPPNQIIEEISEYSPCCYLEPAGLLPIARNLSGDCFVVDLQDRMFYADHETAGWQARQLEGERNLALVDLQELLRSDAPEAVEICKSMISELHPVGLTLEQFLVELLEERLMPTLEKRRML
jgi:hypothetical protein